MRKLRDWRGETLTETLCAVLVLALAVALLGAMIATSFRLDQKTDQAAGELYKYFSEAEKSASGTDIKDGTITVQIGDDSDKQVAVKFYGNTDQVVSYRVEAGEKTP